MAKSVTRPDTPLAATSEPKMVSRGRLEQVRDSLMSKSEDKLKKQYDLMSQSDFPRSKRVRDEVNSLNSSAGNDLKYATKYHKIIDKSYKK